MNWLLRLIHAINEWYHEDPVLARIARLAYIRQEMDRHPSERGDNWR